MIGGGNELYDIMDEVEAYKAGFLFTTKDAIDLVANGKITLEWFKATKLNTDQYRHLTGLEGQLTINTPAATYMKYYSKDRISWCMQTNKNNANITVKEAIDIANKHSSNSQPEYRYGDLLNTINP